jgi:hypothetical protein
MTGALQMVEQIRFNTVIFDQVTVTYKAALFEAMLNTSGAPAGVTLSHTKNKPVYDDIEKIFQVSKDLLKIDDLIETLDHIEQQQRSELLVKPNVPSPDSSE